MRASCEDRSNRWLYAGTFTSNKAREFHYALPILTLLLQSFPSLLEVVRVRVAVLVVHLPPIFDIHLPGQRKVPCASQRISYALRTHSPEFVREAEVDVVM
jgi:hypothetical protein